MASLNLNCMTEPSDAFLLGASCTTLDCDPPAFPTEHIVVSRIVTTVPINLDNSSCFIEEMTTPPSTKLREITVDIENIVSLPDCDVSKQHRSHCPAFVSMYHT